MYRTSKDIAERLWDERKWNLYRQVLSLLLTLQELLKTAAWQRPPEQTLRTIHWFCKVLHQHVATVEAETLEWQGGGGDGV